MNKGARWYHRKETKQKQGTSDAMNRCEDRSQKGGHIDRIRQSKPWVG